MLMRLRQAPAVRYGGVVLTRFVPIQILRESYPPTSPNRFLYILLSYTNNSEHLKYTITRREVENLVVDVQIQEAVRQILAGGPLVVGHQSLAEDQMAGEPLALYPSQRLVRLVRLVLGPGPSIRC